MDAIAQISEVDVISMNYSFVFSQYLKLLFYRLLITMKYIIFTEKPDWIDSFRRMGIRQT